MLRSEKEAEKRNSYEDRNVINGTFGECWIDNDYMAEAIGLKAKIKLDTTEVKMTGTLSKGTKVTGKSGSGTVKLNKISSYFIKRMDADLKAGKATRATIITNLEDPEAFGAEKIALNNCVFTELTIADWEAGKLCEESVPFTFSDFDVLEAIE